MQKEMQFELSTAVKFFLAGVGLGALLAVISLPSPDRQEVPAISSARASHPAA